MNIYTVRDNLKKTIEGKEKYLAELNKVNAMTIPSGEALALSTTYKFLQININELKVILFDVEKCCEQYSLMSWAGSVDRQSGAFDQSELQGRDGWQ